MRPQFDFAKHDSHFHGRQIVDQDRSTQIDTDGRSLITENEFEFMDYDFEDQDSELEDVDQDHDADQLQRGHLDEESSYVCNSCGEEIVVPLDYSQGQNQQYVEDCPVCCNPNVIFVEFSHDGEANIWSRAE